jgi:HlyD family secretion protein
MIMTRFHVSALAGLLATLTGCSPTPSHHYQGYAEGEFVYVGAPQAGILTNLCVTRGMEVTRGQLLFELEGEAEKAASREATHRIQQAKAKRENLLKGRRPSEIAALEAQLERAKSSLQLSEMELQRRKGLIEAKVISTEELDTTKARRDADAAQVASIIADLETAKLGGREDEIKMAEAEVAGAEAVLVKAQWAVTQRRQVAPAAGRIQDTLYRAGEVVGAGQPVISLLPPENLKVRFFIPQADLVRVGPGTAVEVTADGLAAPLRARVNYVSSQAEFTPPVIYSKENRAKLVFMVEAVFPSGATMPLKPGQPAEVRLSAGDRPASPK